MIALLAALLATGSLQNSAQTVAGIGHVRLVLTPAAANDHVDVDVLYAARLVIERRIAAAGLSGSVRVDDGRILVETSGVTDPDALTLLVAGVGLVRLRVLDSLERLKDDLLPIDSLLGSAGVAPLDSGPPGGGGDLQQVFGRELSPGGVATPHPPARVLSELLYPGQLPGEYLVLSSYVARVDTMLRMAQRHAFPRGVELVWGSSTVRSAVASYHSLYGLDPHVLLAGEEVNGVSAQRDAAYGAVLRLRVAFGSRQRVCEATRRLTDDYIVLVVDNKAVGRPSRMARAMCDGSIDVELPQARFVAAMLGNGLLPVPLDVVAASVDRASLHGASVLTVAATVLVLAALYVVGLTVFARKRAAS